MKINDFQKLMSGNAAHSAEGQQQIHDLLRSMDIDPSNLYQELEMSSRYVNTHRDSTYINTPVSLHSHNYYEILYCHSAAGVEYLVGSGRYKLQQGDIILISPGVSHRPILPERLEGPYVRDVLWVNAGFMESLKQTFPHGFSGNARPPLIRTAGTHWDFLGQLFQAGVREEEQRRNGWEAVVLGNSLQLLVYLDRAYADFDTGSPKAEQPELIDLVTAYIEAHYTEHITVSEIARRFYISDSSVSHLFKQKMSVSIYHYITQRRLIYSKSLIGDGVPLEHVAVQVGFSDYSAFYRAFKHEYGISPRQYRNLQENA